MRRAGERLGHGLEATVVALAGPTGAGKSTLFNALAGPAARPRGRHAADHLGRHRRDLRPARTAGCSTGWRCRRGTRSDGGGPDGLVLLDLPDFDSVETAHRLEVDRLVRLVDLLVWVVDPQKYADAALHDRYLRPLAGHAAAMLVVLNQSDRLGADADRAREDLARLLAAAGPRRRAGARRVGADGRRARARCAPRWRSASRAARRRSRGSAPTWTSRAARSPPPRARASRPGVRRGDRAQLLATLGTAAGHPGRRGRRARRAPPPRRARDRAALGRPGCGGCARTR